MIRIAIDLELESDGKITGDIIELGYTIFSTKTNEIIYTGGSYVKVNRPLHPFIINLTKITDNVLDEHGVSIHEAYHKMVDTFNRLAAEERDKQNLTEPSKGSEHSKSLGKHAFYQIIEWGSGDVYKLKEELLRNKFEDYTGQDLKPHQEKVYFIPFSDELSAIQTTDLQIKNNYTWMFGRASLNLKAVYQMRQIANGLKYSGGLKTSLKKMGIEFDCYKEELVPGKIRQRGEHTATADSLNTAKMYLKIHEQMKAG